MGLGKSPPSPHPTQKVDQAFLQSPRIILSFYLTQMPILPTMNYNQTDGDGKSTIDQIIGQIAGH